MDLTSLFFLILSTLTFFFFLLLLLRRRPSETAAPGTLPKPYPIFGNVPHFIKNGPRLVDWTTDLILASPTGTVTVSPMVFTADPANVDHIARSNFTSYQKIFTQTVALHDFLGLGIFNADGDVWRVQRKTASFEFNTKSIRSFVHHTVEQELTTRLLPILAKAADENHVVDLQELLERFAFDNIVSLVFNHDPAVLGGEGGSDGERFYHAFDDATHLSIHRFYYPCHWMWKLLGWLNVGSERRLRAAVTTVHSSIHAIIKNRHTRSGSDGDLLSRFAESKDQLDVPLHEILISFLMAGRDTTPSALSWFFLAISSLPEVTENILEEIRAIRSTGVEGMFGLDDLRGMQYLHSAITESMRLYPPVTLTPRECIEDDVLPDGTKVKKGWKVWSSTYAMGRSEKVWGKDCLEFKPERWMKDGVFKPESSSKYLVFNTGPRVCLGKEMAYIQMKALVVAVIEKFEFEVTEERGEKEVLMTMRVVGGLPVRVKKRNA